VNSMIRTFAAIDIGSSGLEMGIYELSEKFGIRLIDQVRYPIALGEDTWSSGKISYRRVDETCEALAEFARIMKGYQVENCRAYATSALREAQNSQIVVDQIRVRTGIEVRIISNSEQRFISYKAIAYKDAEFQKVIQKGTAILDVGNGSTQISLFDKDSLVSTQNLPLGAIRLMEIMRHMKTTAEKEQKLIQELVDNELVTFRKIYLKDRKVENLIGVGKVTLVLYRRIMGEVNQRDRITVEEFNRFYGALGRMTLDQIEDTFEVNAVYASLLLPAATIIRQVLEVTGADNIWVPGTLMLDGIAADYAEERKLLRFNHNFANDIIVTSRNMAKRYKCHMPHIQAVENAALQVFDCMKKYHGLGMRERLLLQIAADLHSCGKFVTMRNATEYAYNIIMATEIIGLSHVEREIVANVVRYHLKTFQYNDIKIDAKPSRSSRLATPDNLTLTVAKLTAILRLANSMDRSHSNKLDGCRIAIKNNKLIISTDYVGDVTLELLSIEEKADFFEEIFGIRPVLKQKKKV
jgi:exopolyphosphatase/guanosine-5'-triphosphate,3'-diphosphate pyrophosphatase